MLRNISFEGVGPDNFHYFLGANCYQHATGWKAPFVALTERGDKTYIFYAAWLPGGFKDDFGNGKATFEARIIRGCFEDGAIDLGQKISHRAGYTTAGLYFSQNSVLDYHFVIVHEDGSRESKTPFAKPTKFFGDEVINMRLDRYLQFPKEVLPPSHALLEPQPLRIQTSSGTIINCLQVDKNARLPWGCILDITKKSLNIYDREEQEWFSVAIPPRLSSAFESMAKILPPSVLKP